MAADAGLGREQRLAAGDQSGILVLFRKLLRPPGVERGDLEITRRPGLVLAESPQGGELGLGRLGVAAATVREGCICWFQPVVEFPRPEGDHPEAHHGVGLAAKLGALPPVIARMFGLQPGAGWAGSGSCPPCR